MAAWSHMGLLMFLYIFVIRNVLIECLNACSMCRNEKTKLLRLRETHNALKLPVFFFFLLFFCQRYPEYRGIRSKQLLQYTVLEIHFWSLNYTTAIRICKKNTQKIEQLSIPTQAIPKARTVCWCKQPTSNRISIPTQVIPKARTVCWCNQSTSNSFQTLQTVYTYSNCTIDQLLYCWEMF